MSRFVRRRIAIAVWAVSWLLAAAALTIMLAAGSNTIALPGVFLSQAPPEVRGSFGIIGTTVAIVFGPVSALLLSRGALLVGGILATHAVGSGIAAFGVQWGLLGAVHPDLPLWGFFAFAAGWGYVPGTFLTAAFPILVTRSRIPRWQWVVFWMCAATAAAAFLASFVQQSVPIPRNPFAIDEPFVQSMLPSVYLVATFLGVGIALVTCGILLVRWSASTGRDRRQTAWLVLGHAFLTISYGILVLPADVPVPRWLVDAGLIAPAAGQVLYSAAILVVVLGQRMWDVEIIVNRIVLWALLTVSGIAVYFVVVVTVPRMLPAADSLWIVVPLAIAVAAHPLRRWLQRRIDLLVYGEGADPDAVLKRLGDDLAELEPGVGDLRQLSRSLRRVLRLGAVELRALEPDAVAVSGRPRGAPLVFPLHTMNRPAGELRVWPPGGQRLDARTTSLIGDIAGFLAATIGLVQANHELGEARSAVTMTRANERRSIQRELHDGLGPALAGIGFGLAAVGNLLPTAPATAHELLIELSDGVALRARGVRELAAEVSTSPLDDRSLAHALTELVERFALDGRLIDARVEDLTLTVTVRDAAYYIAAEALTNAVRHSGGLHIRLTVTAQGDGARVVVMDDGAGISADVRSGVGLASMRQRAEASGGSLSITSTQSGTTLVAIVAPTVDGEE